MEKYVFRLQKICWYWGICLNARGGKKIKPKSKQIFPNGPLDRIVTDTWELPEYLKIKAQYIWVLDIIDYFNKYILLYPLIQKNADNVLLGIKEFCYTLGVPNILQTDNGLDFLNSKLKNFCIEHNIIFIQSRPQNPKYNGVIEVSHKEIRRKVLTKYAIGEKDGDNEDFNLKNVLLEACFTHNNNVHTSTNKSLLI